MWILLTLNGKDATRTFSVSQSNLKQVKEDIAEQEEHHRMMTFQDELRSLLRKPPQGSSFLATLGFGTQSLWDWQTFKI